MKVGEMIERLGKFPSDALVVVRGFDEFGYDVANVIGAITMSKFHGSGLHSPEFDDGCDIGAILID